MGRGGRIVSKAAHPAHPCAKRCTPVCRGVCMGVCIRKDSLLLACCQSRKSLYFNVSEAMLIHLGNMDTLRTCQSTSFTSTGKGTDDRRPAARRDPGSARLLPSVPFQRGKTEKECRSTHGMIGLYYAFKIPPRLLIALFKYICR